MLFDDRSDGKVMTIYIIATEPNPVL